MNEKAETWLNEQGIDGGNRSFSITETNISLGLLQNTKSEGYSDINSKG
jgi:hypothetical protein